MGLLVVVLISLFWAICKIKDDLTPSQPPINDMKSHLNKIMSLSSEEERRNFLKNKKH